MKRFIIAGLCLSVLILCSCSRKKSKEEETPVLEGAPVELDGGLQQSPVPSPAPAPIPEPLEDSPELDEDFLAEEERMGTEVLSFLEDESNFTSPIIEDSQTVEQSENGETPVPEVEPVEKRLVDSYNRLKIMEYGTEIFIPVKNQNNNILIHYSNKTAERLFYDELYRLTKKEYWKMDNVVDSKKTAVELYFYEGDSKKPSEKKIESDTAVFVSKFNQNGFVIRTEKYSVPQEDSKPVSVTTWTYDEKDRITSETVSEAFGTKKQLFIYSKVDKLPEGEEEFPPDYEYYENEILKIKTEYTQKGVYSTTIRFDNVNSIRTDYENYVKLRDVYFVNGVQTRVRNYE